MATEAIVRVMEVHKNFRRGSEQIDVLKGLSLDVPEGEFMALMGPSGSGKTTLLNLIAGLDRPSEGEIWVGGQQQRVGIARAIVTDPTLIVADEPTGDLDSKSADEILNLIGALRQDLNKTIILVTHDPRAAVRAQRVLHLEKGLLVESLAPAGAFHEGRDGSHGDTAIKAVR